MDKVILGLLRTRGFVVFGLLLVSAFALKAAPFVPSNPPEMQPLTNHHSPAFQAAKRFMRGVNLGDYLEAGGPNPATVGREEFALMRAEGFDHVRVPIAWHNYAGPGPEFLLSSNIFAKVDFVVANALSNRLAVIINIHHFNDFDRNPEGAADKLAALWRQIATHYAGFPNELAFEIDNEPHQAATTAAVNPIYPRIIAEMRRTNPKRTIFVEPGNWGGIEEITNLVLPPDDNLIVSAHCYDPFFFTHQGASWAGADVKVTGIQFPGPPAQPLEIDPSLDLSEGVRRRIEKYNTLAGDENPSSSKIFREKLELARAWSDHYGRPVHIGEFGCYSKADPKSRARFYAEFRRALDDQKLGWAVWDWSSNFRYWDKANQRPIPGMREALFGK